MWPNWVDLIILTLVCTMGYIGFGRGFLAEFLNCVSAVAVIVVTMKYAGAIEGLLASWSPFPPAITTLVVYSGFFLMLWYAARVLRKQVAEIVKWERFNWLIQGVGLVLGGLRGLWWAGFVLLVLASSGYEFFQESVAKKSVLAPRLLTVFHASLTQIDSRFPGPRLPDTMLVPPLPPIRHPDPSRV